jgi:glycosyltransferase involved in cell wall biosynthesis
VRIVFLLPGSGNVPIGGYKVVYQYASNLARRGHQVAVVHPALLEKNASIPRTLRSAVRWLQRTVDGSFSPATWMNIDKRVSLLWRWSLAEDGIPDADFVVASAWQTAEWAARYSASKGKKLYLIHDYEHYMSATPTVRARIAATYSMGFVNIVTSPAGEEMLAACNAKVYAVIPNSIELDTYRLAEAIESPMREWVGFPYRTEVSKGTADAMFALEIVRRHHPCLKVWSFGRPATDLPDWVSHHVYPSNQELASLYNRTAVFVTASHYEGWGLPGSEALACGAALATTDNVGARAYAIHGQTALVSAIQRPELLAENILRLLNDRDLRYKLADAGHQAVSRFTEAHSGQLFEQLLLKTAADG